MQSCLHSVDLSSRVWSGDKGASQVGQRGCGGRGTKVRRSGGAPVGLTTAAATPLQKGNIAESMVVARWALYSSSVGGKKTGTSIAWWN